MKELWPVYEFRPLPDALKGQVYRYADGEWKEDDGQYDLAFASLRDRVCLYVDLPYQKNIVWSWCTGHWSGFEAKHPRGNAWHYMLRDGKGTWGGEWGRNRHPNTLAGDSGMTFVCNKMRCANGRSIEFRNKDRHIFAGLVRERETGKVLEPPQAWVCMYCGPMEAAQ